MRWSLLLAVLWIVPSNPVSAQADTAQLRTWLSMVASDEQRGRALATREHRAVVDALASAATSLGLVDADRRGGRPLPLVRLSVGRSMSLERLPRPQLPGVDIIPLFPAEWGYPQQLRMRATDFEVVNVGMVGPATQEFKSYAKKLVLVEPPRRATGLVEYDVLDFLERLSGVKSAVAIGIISLDITPLTYIQRLTTPRFELVETPLMEGWPPIFLLTSQSANAALSSVPERGGPPVPARLAFHIDEQPVAQAPRNRSFVLTGSDPRLKDEYIVVSAPTDYRGISGQALLADSIYNGADDGGSGAVALLGVAQELLRSGVRPKRSILFVWHAGTEHELLGSRWFVREPPVPRRSIAAVINVERLGRGADTLYGVGSYDTPHTLRGDLDRYAASTDQLLDWSWDAPTDPYRRGARSDHAPYLKAGIPAVTINSGVHDDWRTVRDHIDHVDFATFAARVSWLAGAVRAVADAPRRPTMVR